VPFLFFVVPTKIPSAIPARHASKARRVSVIRGEMHLMSAPVCGKKQGGHRSPPLNDFNDLNAFMKI